MTVADVGVVSSRGLIASRFLVFLEQRRVDYCVVGDARGLPADIHGDIDIVVDPRSLPHLSMHMQEFCVRNELKIVQCLRHEVDAYYFVVSWPDDDGRPMFLQLDVCGDYCRDGIRFLSATELLDGRVHALASDGTPKHFYVPNPSRAFLYYLLKRVDKQSLTDPHGEFLSAQWHQDPFAACTGLRRFWTGRHFHLIADAAETGGWSGVRAELPELRRALRRRLRKADHLGLPELIRKAKRVLQPTGVFVALVGPDGSGKSTLAQVVMRDLAPAFRMTCSFHFRPRLGRHQSAGEAVTDPHGRPPRGVAASVAKAAYYLGDYVLGYLTRIRPRLVRSAFLVFDRYSFDFEVDPKRFRYAGPLSIAHLVARLAPAPDLVILLDAPVDALWTRKQEVARDELCRVVERYRRLVASLTNGHVVDATQPVPGVAASVEAVVLAYMARRTHERMSGPKQRIVRQAMTTAPMV
jgi:thymidylate kinase